MTKEIGVYLGIRVERLEPGLPEEFQLALSEDELRATVEGAGDRCWGARDC